MNNPFILFEISKHSPEAHRAFAKSSKPYRYLMRTTEMKYLLMDAWTLEEVMPYRKTRYYINESGKKIIHGHSLVYDDEENQTLVIYEEWRRNGKLHRTERDSWAVYYFNLRKNIQQYEWYKNGKLHRVNNGKPAVQHSDGHCEWWRDGIRYCAPPDHYEYYYVTKHAPWWGL